MSKFTQQDQEDFKKNLLYKKDKKFVEFIVDSYVHTKEFSNDTDSLSNKDKLMELEKNDLKYVKARIESLSEYHDPLKMDSMILPAVTVLFSVLATGFFVNAKMINGSTNSMQISGFTVTGFWIFTIITFILFVLRPGKKKHSKIIFFSKLVDICIEEKEQKKQKKEREEKRIEQKEKEQEEQEKRKEQREKEEKEKQRKESDYKLVRLYLEKLVMQEEMKEVKRSRRKRYKKR
ncbi:TPA: hypothetical protein QCY38_005548 [Bacillus toyonensis]|uniref:hypothetical protein n=1 Tax=Bacillus toyonensis TaxID=155322 RepID=UPI000BF29669|nr:hypothetical protein [Bacillus toyonensis]MCA1045920.1 hypothetical protein [Bacillus toyonensis]MDO8156316.1 hypothetical protein [Bacillus toyonensis]PGC80102.1 hypothetical protein COM39_30625 [Bacillus toyonensis]PHG64387.1 hypothetical protein COI59_16885 [Bacillus toyonensis]QQN81807.1 hypothetical protein I0K03_16320 [Bacillus toyonensis]